MTDLARALLDQLGPADLADLAERLRPYLAADTKQAEKPRRAVRTRRARKSRHHGHSSPTYRSPTYNTWRAMLGRCTHPSNASWENYGRRGIAVCDRWLSFENFLADMGERPEGTTLDREDVNGNYEPDNCRWATSREQGENRR